MKAWTVQPEQCLGDCVEQHYPKPRCLDGCRMVVLRAIVQPMVRVFWRDSKAESAESKAESFILWKVF